MHLDADDLLADGALTKLIPPLDSGQGIGWTSGAVDDLHADGTRTQFPPQLLGHVKKGTPGKYWLEHQVMAFHSVAFICQRHLAAAVGGYPALQASEDTSFVLAATGLADGYVTSDVVAMYRRWEGQTVGRSPSYMATRQAARQLVAERVAALEHLANSRDSSVDDSDISGRVEHATTRPSPDRHDRVPRA